MAKDMDMDKFWQALLVDGHKALNLSRAFNSLIPSDPRCKTCNSPFYGFGGALMRFLGKKPSLLNPLICSPCTIKFEDVTGGLEVDTTILFIDIRGSTSMAEDLTPTEFSAILQRFYGVSSHVLTHAKGFVDKMVGDEVTSYFLPGFVGTDHAQAAIESGRELLRAIGYGKKEGPWLEVGVGIHTGRAYFGMMTTEVGVRDLSAHGDDVNTAARLVAEAKGGEIVLSEASYRAADLGWTNLESRLLNLKGKRDPFPARVLRVE